MKIRIAVAVVGKNAYYARGDNLLRDDELIRSVRRVFDAHGPTSVYLITAEVPDGVAEEIPASSVEEVK